MIVPDHWAEASRRHRAGGKQITVRRFGWSETSGAEALAMAEQRAELALQRMLAGAKLAKRELKLAYNGSDGVPIREEVLARHGEEVITRNAYGAHCLNTPCALFADIDFASAPSAPRRIASFVLIALLPVAAGLWWASWGIGLAALAAALLVAGPGLQATGRLWRRLAGGDEAHVRRRIDKFVAAHPDWNLRLYRSPAGLRVLATHRPFEAGEAAVQEFFHAVSADPVYVRMCVNQRCFRARLTAKPWRIGIAAHMRPRPGVWPVSAARMDERASWIAHYENQARGYAACRFIAAVGSGAVHPRLASVVSLHDRESRAGHTRLPIA